MADDVHPPPSKLPPACHHLIHWIIKPWERLTASSTSLSHTQHYAATTPSPFLSLPLSSKAPNKASDPPSLPPSSHHSKAPDPPSLPLSLCFRSGAFKSQPALPRLVDGFTPAELPSSLELPHDGLQPPSSPEPLHGAPELSLVALYAPQLPPWQQHRPSELRLLPSSPVTGLRAPSSPKLPSEPSGSVSKLPVSSHHLSSTFPLSAQQAPSSSKLLPRSQLAASYPISLHHLFSLPPLHFTPFPTTSVSSRHGFATRIPRDRVESPSPSAPSSVGSASACPPDFRLPLLLAP